MYKDDPVIAKQLEKAMQKAPGMTMKEFEVSMENFRQAADMFKETRKQYPNVGLNVPDFNRGFNPEKYENGPKTSVYGSR